MENSKNRPYMYHHVHLIDKETGHIYSDCSTEHSTRITFCVIHFYHLIFLYYHIKKGHETLLTLLSFSAALTSSSFVAEIISCYQNRSVTFISGIHIHFLLLIEFYFSRFLFAVEVDLVRGRHFICVEFSYMILRSILS